MKESTKDPYKLIKSQYVTEKAVVLQGLKDSESNRCVQACTSPKYVFLVDIHATKREIADAIEEIYADRKIKVVKVNTVKLPAKRRRVRGRIGYKAAKKKAIVTLEAGDSIENV